MKATTSQRLKQIMKERGFKQVDILNRSLPFQKALNVKMGKSALSQYVNGVQSPDQDRIYLLSKTLDINEPWLMGYDVPIKRVPDKDRNKIDIDYVFDQLDKPNQKDVYDYAQFKLQEQNSKVVSMPDMPDTLAAHSDNINEELTPEKLQHNVDVTDEEIVKYIAKQKKDK